VHRPLFTALPAATKGQRLGTPRSPCIRCWGRRGSQWEWIHLWQRKCTLGIAVCYSVRPCCSQLLEDGHWEHCRWPCECPLFGTVNHLVPIELVSATPLKWNNTRYTVCVSKSDPVCKLLILDNSEVAALNHLLPSHMRISEMSQKQFYKQLRLETHTLYWTKRLLPTLVNFTNRG
jgi:hypothetical protein